MINKGNIGVRTQVKISEPKVHCVGKMYKAVSSHGDRFYYENGQSMSSDKHRLASALEEFAFSCGVMKVGNIGYSTIASFVKHEHNLKVGDNVEVVDKDKCYPTYSIMFDKLSFKNKDSNPASNGDRGVISTLSAHGRTGTLLIAINLDDGRECLLGVDGVKKIEVSVNSGDFIVNDKLEIEDVKICIPNDTTRDLFFELMKKEYKLPPYSSRTLKSNHFIIRNKRVDGYIATSSGNSFGSLGLKEVMFEDLFKPVQRKDLNFTGKSIIIKEQNHEENRGKDINVTENTSKAYIFGESQCYQGREGFTSKPFISQSC